MNALLDWFCANKLSLNVAKTNIIIFNAKRTAACNDIHKLDLGNEAIHRVTCTTFIGIYIDEDLEWSAHIDHVAKKNIKWLLCNTKCETFVVC